MFSVEQGELENNYFDILQSSLPSFSSFEGKRPRFTIEHEFNIPGLSVNRFCSPSTIASRNLILADLNDVSLPVNASG